jgi:hypothetical protein
MAAFVQVFRCRHCETIRALRRPASEKRQGRKSRWVGHRRCRGLYGDLASGCRAGRYGRSGRAGRFGSKVGWARGHERVNGLSGDAISDAVSGPSGVSTQVGAPPVERVLAVRAIDDALRQAAERRALSDRQFSASADRHQNKFAVFGSEPVAFLGA